MRFVIGLFVLAAGICANLKSAAQGNDTTYSRFSQWGIRLNPLSVIERLGGLQIGFETNLDKKRRLDLVSEFGYLFLNNILERSDGNNNNRNTNPISGFKSKQEIRWIYRDAGRSSEAIGIENNLRQVSISNSGWFGLGRPSAGNQYSYLKHQDYREELVELSGAIKYILRSTPLKNRIGFEGFGGFGIIHRKVNYKNAEGILVQPDKKSLVDEKMKGFYPYVTLGFRLFLTVKK